MSDAAVEAAPVISRSPVRLAGVAALAILVGLLIGSLVSLLHASATIIPFPYGIDYGEGIVWQQAINIAAGKGYAPISAFPTIVYHYPPVYHVTVEFLAHLFATDGLATGRAVSLAASLASAVLIGLLAIAGADHSLSRSAAVIAGMCGGLIYLTCIPVSLWAPLMRVDMLACAFSLGGLILAIRAIDRPRAIVGAAVCFVLAVYTKQVSIAAPIAAFAGLIVMRPRRAWMLVGISMALGVSLLTYLSVTTDGGFLRHIILYNINRNQLARTWLLIGPLLQHLIYLAIAVVGLATALRTLRDTERLSDAHKGALLMLIAYLAIKTLMLGMIVKSGGATNYMIEWFCAVAIFTALGVGPAISQVIDGAEPRLERTPPMLAVLLIAVLASQVWLLPRRINVEEDAALRRAALTPVVEMIRASSKPVISDDMTLIIRAGKPVQWEPSIAAELAGVGRYDESGFVRMIEQRKIGFFFTEGDHGDGTYDSRYDPAVAAAIARYYPTKRPISDFLLHLPADQPVTNRE